MPVSLPPHLPILLYPARSGPGSCIVFKCPIPLISFDLEHFSAFPALDLVVLSTGLASCRRSISQGEVQVACSW
jgi:hypothetical protein